jgi:acyl-CoA synthetase (AMP-forming)/AMP-acid ligase II
VTATLHDRLAAVSATTPGAPALHLDDATWTFAELLARATATAGAVVARTAPGDRVALVAWNGMWWIDGAFGVPMAGRTLAMISPRLTVAEIAGQLDTVQPALVIVDPAVTTDLGALAAPGRTVIDLPGWLAITSAHAAFLPRAADDPAAVAWLVFTSGTTAAPKAAMLTHRSLLAAVDATAASRPVIADDVYLFPFPLWHVALYNVVCRVVAGRPVVLHGRFDPSEIVAAVARHGVRSMSLAATMLDALLDEVERDPSAVDALASLTDITYGAAPMPASVLQRAAARLDVRFWQGYGMTELSGNAVFLSAEDHRRGLAGDPDLLRAAGRAAPGVELRIADDDDGPLPVRARGEIQVRAAQVMAGYWGNAEATVAALTPDGWLRTGDVGTLDPTGLLHVLDRKKDVIITGGENVSAREVEEVLRQHPAVADVAVVGVPDVRWGENVCAVVVPRGALDADDLRAFARQRLAGFKVPRRLAIREALPVNASGKVVKAELRSWLAANPDALDARR